MTTIIIIYDSIGFNEQLCPDKVPGLVRWNPGNTPDENIVIDGESWLLGHSATVNTITVKNGGKYD